ncbi:MAG: glycoside hydrolase family 20 zincin-like fold domain-containing protein, partial [Armatimonadota bacterium]
MAVRHISLVLVGITLCCCACTPGCGAITPVSPDEAQAWVRYLVPLPKSVEITGKVIIKASDISIAVPAQADKVVQQAVKELRQAIGQSNAAASGAFRIELVLGGPDADKLRSLKNSDQAYSITPSAEGKGLRLAALTSRGLYYASKTLQQLIRARSSGGKVEMPIVRVTDWPDLEDRGLWGGDSGMNVEWLAERKMNVIENISTRSVDGKGRGSSGPKPFWKDALLEGPIRGINCIPAVLHLEQVAGPYGEGGLTLFDIYPNLKAKDSEGGAICYSQPQFVDVLADWIVDLKKLPNVTDVSVWLAENLHGKGGCKCDQCKKTDRTVLEFRTILAAWKKAQERLGTRFGLRILTSEETRPSNKLLFKEVPQGVKAWYYDSLLTYTTGKEPMITGDVLDFIKAGGWVGPVPNLSAFVRLVHPFICPEFSHYRMNEYVDKGCRGLLGYACMGLKNSRFIVEGAAEWSWNAKGRSPREFALSWAVRNGLKDPEKFAQWTDLHGPVAWDVYGSDFPYSEKRNIPGPLAKNIREGTLPPLGFTNGPFRGPWGQIKSIEQFDRDVANEHKALEIAREMGVDEFIYESLVV